MPNFAWKRLLSSFLLVTFLIFAVAAQAQQPSVTAAAAAVSHSTSAPHSPAAAAVGAAAPASSSNAARSEGPDPDRKWELEVHGGGILSTNPGGGTGTLPGPGVTFIDLSGDPSRAISSYYFGDGALLFNQFIAAAGPLCLGCTPITPLDGVLTTPTAKRGNGGAFGFRVSREITPRWVIEGNFDYSLAEVELSSAGLAGLEATRASWAAAWTNMLANTTATGVAATSTARVHSSGGSQVFGTVGVNFNLKTQGRVIPYVSIGAGAVGNTGDPPTAVLTGDLQLTFKGPHHNIDTIVANWSPSDVQAVGYFGGGAKYYVSPRWGFRLDVRDYLSGNTLQQFISASPQVLTLAPAEAIPGGVTPDIQFSNNPASGQDTLSGPVITRFRTFSGDGIRHQLSISGGIFFRF